jgi:hypothetical protein
VFDPHIEYTSGISEFRMGYYIASLNSAFRGGIAFVRGRYVGQIEGGPHARTGGCDRASVILNAANTRQDTVRLNYHPLAALKGASA